MGRSEIWNTYTEDLRFSIKWLRPVWWEGLWLVESHEEACPVLVDFSVIGYTAPCWRYNNIQLLHCLYVDMLLLFSPFGLTIKCWTFTVYVLNLARMSKVFSRASKKMFLTTTFFFFFLLSYFFSNQWKRKFIFIKHIEGQHQ